MYVAGPVACQVYGGKSISQTDAVSYNQIDSPSPLSLTHQANTFNTEPPLLHKEPAHIPVSRGEARSVRTIHVVGMLMDCRIRSK